MSGMAVVARRKRSTCIFRFAASARRRIELHLPAEGINGGRDMEMDMPPVVVGSPATSVDAPASTTAEATRSAWMRSSGS